MKLNGLLDLGRSLPAFDELVVGLREGRAPAAPLAIYHAANRTSWRLWRASLTGRS